MINKSLREITKSDLEALFREKTAESKTLDYKSQFSANNKLGDFLEDICALGNTAGGDLLIGVKAEDAVPIAYTPISVVPDAEILALENAIRDGIEPRLVGTEMWPVEIQKDQYVLIVRVRKSWNAPHRDSKSRRFMGRNSRGNYEFDVTEIRNAFAMAEDIPQKIRRFRADRIIKIQSDEGPVVVPASVKLLLHLIPLTAFATTESMDLTGIDLHRELPVFDWQREAYRRNLDGMLSHATTTGEKRESLGYVQLFRNGTIEAVTRVSTAQTNNIVSIQWIEGYLPKAIQRFIALYKRHEIVPPVYIFVTMFGFKDIRIGWQSTYNEHSEPLDRQIADMPELVLDDHVTDNQPLRPLLYHIWNAFGMETVPRL